MVGEGCERPEYALGALEATEDAREVPRLLGTSIFCAAADEPPDVLSAEWLRATEALSASSSSDSAMAFFLPLPLPLVARDLATFFSTWSMKAFWIERDVFDRVSLGILVAGIAEPRLRLRGRTSSLASAAAGSSAGAGEEAAAASATGEALSSGVGYDNA